MSLHKCVELPHFDLWLTYENKPFKEEWLVRNKVGITIIGGIPNLEKATIAADACEYAHTSRRSFQTKIASAIEVATADGVPLSIIHGILRTFVIEGSEQERGTLHSQREVQAERVFRKFLDGKLLVEDSWRIHGNIWRRCLYPPCRPWEVQIAFLDNSSEICGTAHVPADCACK